MANEIYIQQRNGNGPRVMRKLTPTAGQALRFDANKKLIVGGNALATAYATSGALTIQPGMAFLTKAGVDVMTLAAPTDVTHDGLMMTIVATTANAHTVTQTTPGFNGGGSASDVATFGGAIGDNLQVVAYGGVWHIVNKTNVTLG